jgi:hypothetical protein
LTFTPLFSPFNRFQPSVYRHKLSAQLTLPKKHCLKPKCPDNFSATQTFLEKDYVKSSFGLTIQLSAPQVGTHF